MSSLDLTHLAPEPESEVRTALSDHDSPGVTPHPTAGIDYAPSPSSLVSSPPMRQATPAGDPLAEDSLPVPGRALRTPSPFSSPSEGGHLYLTPHGSGILEGSSYFDAESPSEGTAVASDLFGPDIFGPDTFVRGHTSLPPVKATEKAIVFSVERDVYHLSVHKVYLLTGAYMFLMTFLVFSVLLALSPSPRAALVASIPLSWAFVLVVGNRFLPEEQRDALS